MTVVGTGRTWGKRGTRGKGRKIKEKGGNMVQVKSEPDIVTSQQLVNRWADPCNMPLDASFDEIIEGYQDLEMAITNRQEALNTLTKVLNEVSKEVGPVLVGDKYEAVIEEGRVASISLRNVGDTNG